MCGRLNVTDEPLAAAVSSALGVNFKPRPSADLRPTQEVAALAGGRQIHQINGTWGIKPKWAKKLLINAQAETVAVKPTFKKAFIDQRCVIPCSGWYEWSACDGSKRKYLFHDPDDKPLYMAAIYYVQVKRPETVDSKARVLPEIVTLTTAPLAQCEKYHHRMPLFIREEALEDWFRRSLADIAPLLMVPDQHFQIEEAA